MQSPVPSTSIQEFLAEFQDFHMGRSVQVGWMPNNGVIVVKAVERAAVLQVRQTLFFSGNCQVILNRMVQPG